MPLYNENNSGLVLPVETRTTAIDSDYVFMIDATTNIPYRITKGNLLAGLSSGGSNGSSGSGSNDTYFSDVVVLMDGGSLTNKATHFTPTITPNGVTSSTTNYKWGGSSLRFPGSTFLDLTDANDFNVGSQDATIELWFNPDTTLAGGNGQVLFEMRPDGSNGAYPELSFDGTALGLYFNGSTVISASQTFTANTWYYVALKKASNLTSLWVNNTQIGSFTTGDWGNGGRLAIGGLAFRSAAPSTYFVGYIDDFRFTLGVARDVSTIPTAAFPNS